MSRVKSPIHRSNKGCKPCKILKKPFLLERSPDPTHILSRIQLRKRSPTPIAVLDANDSPIPTVVPTFSTTPEKALAVAPRYISPLSETRRIGNEPLWGSL